MPRLSDANNPAKVDMPPEMLEIFSDHERRLQAMERDIAELNRQPWQADIASVRNAIPTWSTLSGKPATFTPSSHTHFWADITDKPATFTPGSHTHPWDDVSNGVTGKPTTFTPASHGNEAHSSTFSIAGHAHAWTDITSGVPASFTPSAHNHNWADITTGTQPAPVAHGNEKHTSTFITGVAWADITSKPTTFTPASHGNEAHSSVFATTSHSHAWADITSKPTSFTPASHGNEAHTSSGFATATHIHYYYDKHAVGETNDEPRATGTPG